MMILRWLRFKAEQVMIPGRPLARWPSIQAATASSQGWRSVSVSLMPACIFGPAIAKRSPVSLRVTHSAALADHQTHKMR
jgi:hypothetical protein